MASTNAAGDKSTGTTGEQSDEQRDVRERRARWEAMEVTIADPSDGVVNVRNVSKADPSIYSVQTEPRNGRPEPVACSCPDWQHRQPDGGCKHMRKVRASEPVIQSLRQARMRADGGHVAPDRETITDDRPNDCDCEPWMGKHDLPCWPCYREGFRTPDPQASQEGDE